MTEKKQQTAYPLRMPTELRGQLTEAAKTNNRSLNAEIIARLEFVDELSREISVRTDGDMDYSGMLGWMQYVEGMNVEQREELIELRNNPIVLDGAALANQVASALASKEQSALIAFLALQAAFPELITDKQRERVMLYAANLVGSDGKDPEAVLDAMTAMLAGKVLSDDIGL